MKSSSTQRPQSNTVTSPKGVQIILVILIAVFSVFGQSLKFQFVWDDINFNIVGNPYLNQKETTRLSPLWEQSYAKLYIPITYTAWHFQAKLSRALFPNYKSEDKFNTTDLNPTVFHAFNIILHTLNSLLVALLAFRLFPQIGSWGSLIAAIFYAIHPLQIEVVAWVTGLKDLLSTFFIIVAILSWLHYRSSARVSAYFFTTVFFIAALLSKPSAIIVPLLLLVIDCLHLKVSIKQSFKSIERLLYISIAWTAFTKILQPDDQAHFTSPLWSRPFIALDAFSFYIQKFILPYPLCIDYGRTPQYILEQPWVGLTAYIPVFLFMLILKTKSGTIRERSLMLFIFTLATLSPTLGIIPFEYQSRYSTVADRYAHLALIPMGIAVATVTTQFIKNKAAIFVPTIFAIMILIGVLSHHYTRRWENNLRLYESDLKINPKSQHLQINYSVAYSNDHSDRVANVLPNAIASIQIQHDFYEGLNSLGVIYNQLGNHDLALRYLRRAEFVRPDLDKPQRNIALILYNLKRYQESLPHFEQYLKMQPLDLFMLEKLAETYYQLKNWPEALRKYQKLSQSQPTYAKAFVGLAASAINLGQYSTALQASKEALRLLPSSYDALVNLATALIALNQHSEAIPHLEQAISIEPQNPKPHLLLASIYHHLNFHSKKEQHLQKAKTLAEDNPDPDTIKGIQTLSTPIPTKKNR